MHMTAQQEIEAYLQEAAHDTFSFLEACRKNLGGMAERAMISSVAQYVDLVKKGLSSRTDERSCVSRLDIIETQISAMRKCLIDLDQIRDCMLSEDRLN
jgi:hypothetical protein